MPCAGSDVQETRSSAEQVPERDGDVDRSESVDANDSFGVTHLRADAGGVDDGRDRATATGQRRQSFHRGLVCDIAESGLDLSAVQSQRSALQGFAVEVGEYDAVAFCQKPRHGEPHSARAAGNHRS